MLPTPKIAETQNVIRAMSACDSLLERSFAVPGLGLLYGDAGLGKTTIASVLSAKYDGVSIRCDTDWSARTMIEDICLALGIEPAYSIAKTKRSIIDSLSVTKRPLIIDEIDHLFFKPRLLETLRDIHDKSDAAMIFIGMAGVERKFLRYRQSHRRITQSVELEPVDLDDLQLLARTVCRPPVADDLIAFLLRESKGNTGYAVVGLSQIEKFCLGLETVTLSDWEEVGEPLFLGAKIK